MKTLLVLLATFVVSESANALLYCDPKPNRPGVYDCEETMKDRGPYIWEYEPRQGALAIDPRDNTFAVYACNNRGQQPQAYSGELPVTPGEYAAWIRVGLPFWDGGITPMVHEATVSCQATSNGTPAMFARSYTPTSSHGDFIEWMLDPFSMGAPPRQHVERRID